MNPASMFDFNTFREILGTIRKNKMRTLLTGFAVAWGIFMLIVLLGAGNGLRNGVMSNFAGRAVNSISVFGGWTSVPYGGMKTNRRIRFDQNDYDLIRTQLPEVQYVSARTSQTFTLSYEKEYGSWTLEGVAPDQAYISNIRILEGRGRFLSRIDMENRKKVVVISPEIERVLFKDEDPLGKYILSGEIAYQVIGVYDDANQPTNNAPAYIPFSTAQTLYDKGYGFRRIDFTVTGVSTPEANDAFEKRLREKMGKLHTFNPTDRSALYVGSTAKDAQQAEQVFTMINLFILIIGLASLMAGIVGVGNIMLITVKERTREIGIRKAIGASPASVVELIILEAILITTCAGYVGIVLGVGLTEGIAWAMGQGESEGPSVFLNPTVDLGTILWATLFLIACGVAAGLVPALKAARVRPIEAMRAE